MTAAVGRGTFVAGGVDIDALERILARHELKLVALQPSCQNPTGADLSPARRERLLELARTRGFFVLEDRVHANMRYEGEQPRSLRAYAPPCRPRYLQGDRHDRLLARTLPIYRRRRDALLRALERHLGSDASWMVPAGGHHVWVTLHEPLDERALYAEALRAGMTFLPAGALQAERSSRTSLRLSFSLVAPEAHDEALRRLATALREVRRRGLGSATGALS